MPRTQTNKGKYREADKQADNTACRNVPYYKTASTKQRISNYRLTCKPRVMQTLVKASGSNVSCNDLSTLQGIIVICSAAIYQVFP